MLRKNNGRVKPNIYLASMDLFFPYLKDRNSNIYAAEVSTKRGIVIAVSPTLRVNHAIAP